MSEATTGGARRSGLLAIGLIPVGIIAAVVLLIGGTASGILLYRSAHLSDSPFSLSNDGRPIPTDATRHQAIAVAEQFCLRMDAVDGSDPTGYVKRVEELLTTKQKAKFETEFKQFQQLGISAGLKGTGTILASGIGDIDADSATVLVAHDSAVQASSGTTERHYRWLVSLRKIGSDWLVDDFSPVS